LRSAAFDPDAVVVGIEGIDGAGGTGTPPMFSRCIVITINSRCRIEMSKIFEKQEKAAPPIT
jgi:hypothetical protein